MPLPMWNRPAVACVTGCTVNAILPAGDNAQAGWTLQTNGDAAATRHFDAVIVATDPERAAALLAAIPGAPALPAFEHEPITTCYLQYDAGIRLAQPFLALVDDAGAGIWGQFVFDRGQLTANQAGLLAVVVSTSAQAIASGQDALSAAVAQQLADALRQPALLTPRWSKVISEKRATFVCTPALARPAVETGLHNLFLAGDYVASDYPATLEAAVQSGVAAAHLVKT